jgi:hypothetical protein
VGIACIVIEADAPVARAGPTHANGWGTLATVGAYETRLRAGLGAVAEEAGDFFRGAGPLRRALLRLARELEREGVPYAVVGAMALGGHGFVRMTEDVDVLVTAEGLARFRDRLVGRGYAPTHAGAMRQFRDVESGVRIEFLVAGEFPGDGRPKPVAFPDPAHVASRAEEGVRFVDLEPLVELSSPPASAPRTACATSPTYRT